MAKAKTQYVCDDCGSPSPKWAGRCGECGAWNSMTEVAVYGKGATATNAGQVGYAGAQGGAVIQSLAEVSAEDAPRVSTTIEEFDRVLGGGLVPGAVVLIGGDPGIGKSTLLLQTVAQLSTQKRVLYVTGEESLQQVSLRAKRLDLEADSIQVLAETQIESILGQTQKAKADIIIIDSIQTIFTDSIQSAPGSVSQLRESSAQLVRFAKQTQTTVILVGHVTKEGALAGPRVLEHMVDTVLYFEGDRDGRFRAIRAVKNRFGAVNELGIFAMTAKGLRAVSNPSAIFVASTEAVPGSAVIVSWEGSRPLLVEVQALVDDSHMPNPRRVAIGVDANRLTLTLAVLSRHAGVSMYNKDVFINIVGGVRVAETAADLGLMMAILSSLRDRPLPRQTVIFGEVGLAGEIRPVQNGQERLKEAIKLGYTRAIVPSANCPKKPMEGIEVIGVNRVTEVCEYC